MLKASIFSLSLRGRNVTDYLREAHRTLKLDGHLHIYESTSRFKDREQFVRDLARLGFDVFPVEDAWKFTYIHAIKTEQRPDPTVTMTFGE